jgi:pilus assembly protein CpaF
VGRRIDRSQPLVDARLPDGSRVNAIIPPLACKGPTLTIRKFPAQRLTMDDLVEMGSVTASAATFLRACVIDRRNILVSGGTGTGKTTMLNILSGFIPFKERIVTIEDTTELRLHQEHVVTLETKPPNIEGAGAYTVRDLVKNSLRMRPDRVIVGECRGPEALDMIQAMNTGHDGSMTTVHANSTRDAMMRVETMVMMAGFDLPVKAIRTQFASAINLIVQASRLTGGPRKIINVTEVTGMEGDVITMQDIFKFEQIGVSGKGRAFGRFVATGLRPSFLDRLQAAGCEVNPCMFEGRVLAVDEEQ